MKDYEKIKAIVSDKENFKLEDGKVFIKDMFKDWVERKQNSLGQISMFNGVFSFDDVVAVACGKKYELSDVSITESKDVSEKVFEDGKKLWEQSIPKNAPTEKTGLFYNIIGGAEITLIRKMVKDGKSINKISEALNANRTTISYLVGKIKRGEKLKKEN